MGLILEYTNAEDLIWYNRILGQSVSGAPPQNLENKEMTLVFGERMVLSGYRDEDKGIVIKGYPDAALSITPRSDPKRQLICEATVAATLYHNHKNSGSASSEKDATREAEETRKINSTRIGILGLTSGETFGESTGKTQEHSSGSAGTHTIATQGAQDFLNMYFLYMSLLNKNDEEESITSGFGGTVLSDSQLDYG